MKQYFSFSMCNFCYLTKLFLNFQSSSKHNSKSKLSNEVYLRTCIRYAAYPIYLHTFIPACKIIWCLTCVLVFAQDVLLQRFECWNLIFSIINCSLVYSNSHNGATPSFFHKCATPLSNPLRHRLPKTHKTNFCGEMLHIHGRVA